MNNSCKLLSSEAIAIFVAISFWEGRVTKKEKEKKNDQQLNYMGLAVVGIERAR